MKMRFKINPFQRFSGYLSLFFAIWIIGITSQAFAQRGQEGVMEVAGSDASGQKRFNFDFVSKDLKALIEFLGKETDLTIIASENDIKDKKFALTNLKNVTINEVLEEVKTVLAQYDLAMIRTNKTLLITTFEKAVQMKVPVKRIKADPNQVEATDEIQTYIIQLTSAVASEMVNGIKPLLNKSANVFADATSNSLVITDVASNVRRIATILQVADEAPEIPLKVMIIPLNNANARSLAQNLSQFFREDGETDKTLKRLSASTDPEEMRKMLAEAREKGLGIDLLQGRIQVAADDSSNSLIIKASEANIIALKELISQLDTVPDVQTDIKIFRLNFAIAEDVAETLEEVITGVSAGRRPGRNAEWWERRDYDRRRRDMRRDRQREGAEYQGIVGEVNISSNERLNAVVVSSDPRNFPLVEKLIKELDQSDPQEEIRIYFLQFADSQQTSDNLQDLFEGGSAGRDRGRPWWDRNERRPSEGGFGVQGEVHLVPDTRLNALMVSTADQNFETIEGIIKRLDVNMPDQEWGTRIYRLKYADSENVSDMINNVYQGSGGNQRGFFSFVPGRQRNQNQGSLAGNVTAEPYPTLNSVIVSTATQRNFELITQFIEEIDTPTPEGQKELTKSIRLEYASAEEIQQVLSQVWEDDSGGGFNFGRFFARGGRLEQKDINSLRGKVTVFADAGTNSLIVTTLERYLPDVEALIRELDFVRGQVWIDIQILEVTLDETTKLGIELTAQENKIFGQEVRSGNPLVGELDTRLGLDSEISGFNYSLATKEYLAVLHALMRENKVRTLSTPSLLTRDNQSATWNRGRNIPFLQSVDDRSLLGNNNLNQPLFNYEFIDPPVGINVTITPHIAKSQEAADGKRTIGLEIEQIQASNFIEFTDFNAPITEESSISAYIDVEDGQQIVVGGMIRSSQKEIQNKMPILGDIPFLGRLFRKTETISENSEIVMIITPHIIDIRNPGDLEKLEKQTDQWRNNGNHEDDEDDTSETK